MYYVPLKNPLLAVAALAASAFGAALPGPEECASLEPSDELLEAARQMQVEEGLSSRSLVHHQRRQANITVPTYVHIVATSTSKSQGWLSDEIVQKFINDTNAAYTGTGFQFSLQGVDRQVNGLWAKGDDTLAMRAALRKGDYKTLNLYYIPALQHNGQCDFPDSRGRGGGGWLARDGCLMRSSTHANGQTTPHEIGHWFGLMHTFTGKTDCDPVNDMIDDTPALINRWSCDANDDTCPQLDGKDPVTNYMSYGKCRSEFSEGQKARMASMYSKFRA